MVFLAGSAGLGGDPGREDSGGAGVLEPCPGAGERNFRKTKHTVVGVEENTRLLPQ